MGWEDELSDEMVRRRLGLMMSCPRERKEGSKNSESINTFVFAIGFACQLICERTNGLEVKG